MAVKHYVQFTEFNVPSATVSEFKFVDATDIPSINTADEVQQGSVIKAIFVELWLSSDTATNSSFVVTVEKSEANSSSPALSDMTNIHFYANKKNILFTSQGLLPEVQQNPVPILRQWIKIPKGKQRFGYQDRFRLMIAAIGTQQLTGCMFATYKSYS